MSAEGKAAILVEALPYILEFRGKVVGEAEVSGIPAVVTEVEGSAYRSGEHVFELDPDDPLGEGFLLR